jgi:hypothetical protein
MKMDAREQNLRKLSKTNLLMNFVKKHDASWDHQAWLELCALLQEKGYTPIDFDQVGVALEAKRTAYLEKK